MKSEKPVRTGHYSFFLFSACFPSQFSHVARYTPPLEPTNNPEIYFAISHNLFFKSPFSVHYSLFTIHYYLFDYVHRKSTPLAGLQKKTSKVSLYCG